MHGEALSFMTETLSGTELLEKAIEIKQKGIELYSFLSKNTEKDELKILFNSLVESDRNHIKVFQSLITKFEKEKLNYPANWDTITPYFKAIIDIKLKDGVSNDKILSQELNDEIASIQIAISFKKDNILYFKELLDLIENASHRKTLNDIILQEKQDILSLFEAKRG